MNRLTILLASALAVLTSAASAEPLKAALFADRGCLGNGVAFWAELLHDSPDVELKIVDGADIRAGALGDRELLVMPGGHGKPQYEALGDEGAERIRAFVRDGGRYFGTCCGFSMALNENRKDMKRLKMLPFRNKKSRGFGGFTAKIVFTANAAKALGLESPTQMIRYHDGPIVERTEDVPGCTDVEVLATMRCELSQFDRVKDLMYGSPAVVRATYGEGRMLVFNCHPEMFPSTRFIVADGIRMLTGRDVRFAERPLKPRGAERVRIPDDVVYDESAA